MALLLRGSLGWCVAFENIYMVSNSLLELGLVDLVKLFLSLGLTQSEADHSIFYRSQSGRHILLVVYVDDIVLIGDDNVGITELKAHIHQQFQTKDLGPLRYCLGIDVA